MAELVPGQQRSPDLLDPEQAIRRAALECATMVFSTMPSALYTYPSMNRPVDSQAEAEEKNVQASAVFQAEQARVMAIAQRFEGYIRDGQTFTDADLTALATEQQ